MRVGIRNTTRLAISACLSQLAGETDVTEIELAQRVGRGFRSAVGLHGFSYGGLIVDAGQHTERELGELAVRLAMPIQWRVLLVTPRETEAGLSGEHEERAFGDLGSMSDRLTDRLCRLVLTELIPAVQLGDFSTFSESVFEYGRLVGDFFAPVQGGTF